MYWHVSDPRYTGTYRKGQRISPGNWGRIIRAVGPTHPNWSVEMLLEARRTAINPTAPSRLDATYLYTSLRAALRWAQMQPGRRLQAAIPLSQPFYSDLIFPAWIQEMLREGNLPEAIRGADLYWRGACPRTIRRDAWVEGEALCSVGALVLTDPWSLEAAAGSEKAANPAAPIAPEHVPAAL